MAGRQLIIRCLDGKWSASYSDRPEERYYGVTMQEAVDRLVKARSTPQSGLDSAAVISPMPDDDRKSG